LSDEKIDFHQCLYLNNMDSLWANIYLYHYYDSLTLLFLMIIEHLKTKINYTGKLSFLSLSMGYMWRKQADLDNCFHFKHNFRYIKGLVFLCFLHELSSWIWILWLRFIVRSWLTSCNNFPLPNSSDINDLSTYQEWVAYFLEIKLPWTHVLKVTMTCCSMCMCVCFYCLWSISK
jgi:hypothetical protein